MLVFGEKEPLTTVADVRAKSPDGRPLEVHSLAWHGLTFPIAALRADGIVWGDLFLQYEDLELGMRFRRRGLHCYLIPAADCAHPAPPSTRTYRIFGRRLDVTAQNVAKEYLTLRNGLVVHHQYDGAKFWYGSGPLLVLRGVLSAWALALPKHLSFKTVVLRGVLDAVRGRL